MASFNVYVSEEFDKQLSKITKKDKILIEKKFSEKIIPQLKYEPHFGLNIKKLKNWNPEMWRYRVGNYRIFYKIDDQKKEVDILTIDQRKDAY